MTKYYLNEIENAYAIMDFDNNDFNFNGEDENGYYWIEKDAFNWWTILAGALNYIEEEGIDIDDFEINELEDYVEIAKEHEYNINEAFGRVYAKEIEGYENIDFGCARDFEDAYRFDGNDSDGYFWYENNEYIVEKF